jgi:hypothetical protein
MNAAHSSAARQATSASRRQSQLQGPPLPNDAEEQALLAELAIENAKLAAARRSTGDPKEQPGQCPQPAGYGVSQRGGTSKLGKAAGTSAGRKDGPAMPGRRISGDLHDQRTSAERQVPPQQQTTGATTQLPPGSHVPGLCMAGCSRDVGTTTTALTHVSIPAGPVAPITYSKLPVFSLVKEVITSTGQGASDALGLGKPSASRGAQPLGPWKTRCGFWQLALLAWLSGHHLASSG